MNMLGNAFHKLRVWIGFADATESHLTPSHGWLLPTPIEAHQQRADSDAQRAARLLINKNARA